MQQLTGLLVGEGVGLLVGICSEGISVGEDDLVGVKLGGIVAVGLPVRL